MTVKTSAALSRDELKELIAAAKAAEEAKQQDHERIVADMYSEESLQERFGDLSNISDEDYERIHGEMMEEILSGWETVQDLQRALDQRDELLANLDWAQTLQDHAEAQADWESILLDTYGGVMTDVGQLDDVFGDVVRASWEAASWENARILTETLAETGWDVAGGDDRRRGLG